MSEDNLLDDETILVPQTQPSPQSFSTQLVKRLCIKSFTNRRGDAVNSNTNTINELDVSNNRLQTEDIRKIVKSLKIVRH